MRTVWPSSRKVVSASVSSRDRTSSRTGTSLARKTLWGRYHSRSQWVCGIRWKVCPGIAGNLARAGMSGEEPASIVAGEGLGFELGALGAILEHVHDSNCGGNLFDPAFDQPDVRIIAQSHAVEAFGLSPSHI